MAKQIMYDDVARRKAVAGVEKLAKAVKVTLGPAGKNVIIEKSFGGPQVQDKQTDFRHKFSEDFLSAFQNKYPKEGSVFDYFYDHVSNEFIHWSTKVPVYQPIEIGSKPTETPFTSVSVSTVDSVRMTFIIDMLARNHKFAMLVGTAGTLRPVTARRRRCRRA